MRCAAAAAPMKLNLSMYALKPPASHFLNSGDLLGPTAAHPGGAAACFRKIERSAPWARRRSLINRHTRGAERPVTVDTFSKFQHYRGSGIAECRAHCRRGTRSVLAFSDFRFWRLRFSILTAKINAESDKNDSDSRVGGRGHRSSISSCHSGIFEA